MNMSKVDCKVVMLGSADVGKTCMVERFLHGTWKDKTTTTVGAAFGAKRITVDGTPVTLGIWDTAGSERYESMSKIYYRSAKAAAVCFDLTSRESFLKVKFWVEELLQNEEQCAIYLVGTKLDLIAQQVSERAVAEAEVSAYGESVGCSGIFETSAKDNNKIEELFATIARKWLEKTKRQPQSYTQQPSQAGTVRVDQPVQQPSEGCSC